MHEHSASPFDFTRSKLPWWVFGAAVLTYFLSLNHFVTVNSLPVVARITGWDWAPTLEAPVHFLVTFPFRWLPAGWQSVALNLFSAICAGCTLGLLARSVGLLPHDRTTSGNASGASIPC